jgi:magnesium chelatase subunit I
MLLVSEGIPALRPAVDALLRDEPDSGPGMTASAVELILEGLHLSKRLNKQSSVAGTRYRARA